MTAAALWDQFVTGARADAAALAAAADDAAALATLGQLAFRIGLSSLLLGAEDVGRLAIAIEQAIDRADAGAGRGVAAELATAIATLHAAFLQLAHADRSGARVEDLPVDEHRRALTRTAAGSSPAASAGLATGTATDRVTGTATDRATATATDRATATATGRATATGTATDRATGTATGRATATGTATDRVTGTATDPGTGTDRATGTGTDRVTGTATDPVTATDRATGTATDRATATAAAPTAATTAGFTWTPTVDDDMIELFFDEATERVSALAGKLIEIERRPDDGELLRDVFRDLHTVKGSSAMVGLVPVNQLAHAAEDLVGQIRDAGRAADGPVIDALLAALDCLRDMLGQARNHAAIALDPAAAIARLRNPSAPRAAAPPPQSDAGAAPAPLGRPAALSADARQTIRVDFDKLDRLLNLVGELVLGRDGLRGSVHTLSSITAELAGDRGVARRAAHARAVAGPIAARGLEQLGDELSRVERVLVDVTSDLDQGTDRLDAISGELRDQVMRLRMISVAGVFRKHVRTVRDLAASLGKRARLELEGEDTELDKLLVEALDEPLLHLVRNAVDHGVEDPTARLAAGKPPEATIRIAAAHRGNQVEIRVSDDGRGLDPDRLRRRAVDRGLVSADVAAAMDDAAARELIFRAGFSTAATVSEVSGRGVGMDIVRQTIVARLKGTIEVHSTPGQGSAFVLKLPLTLAIIQVIVARAGGETFAIPLDVVKRVLAIEPREVELIGDREVCVVRGHHVPLIRLDAVLELDGSGDGVIQLVLVEHAGQSYALGCEHLLGKREIVIKSLGPLLANVPCAAGATLLADRVALILDVPAIIARALAQPALRRVGSARSAGRAGGAQILLVEDSDIVRESLRRLLVEAGYLVTVAVDGQHGLELARARHFDLISTDVVMPRLDGYELTRALRAMPSYADTPIVMVTTMGERIDRVRGFDAGVDEYITKPHDRTQLLRVVQKLLGDDGGAR